MRIIRRGKVGYYVPKKYVCRFSKCIWHILGFFVYGEKAKHEKAAHS